MKKALILLKYRDRSVAEMGRRLGAEFPPEAVESVLAELIDLGYIDDRRLAEQLIRDAVSRRHHGPRRVRHELRKKGLDPEIYAGLLEAHLGAEALESTALAATRAHFKGREPGTDEAGVRRLAGYLGRRGFSDATIRAMVQRIRQGDLWDPPE